MVAAIGIPDRPSDHLLDTELANDQTDSLFESILHTQESPRAAGVFDLYVHVARHVHFYVLATLRLVDSAINTAIDCFEGRLV